MDYEMRILEDGEPSGALTASTAKQGRIRQSFGAFEFPSGGMADGRWGVRFRLWGGENHGKRIGTSSIRLKTVSGPAC